MLDKKQAEQAVLLCSLVFLINSSLTAVAGIVGTAKTSPERCRTSILTGRKYVSELLQGHPERFKQITRMGHDTFTAICNHVRIAGLADTVNISVEEQLMMFLCIVGHRWSNRDVQERFQHSGETIHR
jgi:hypothetical protein